MYKSEIKKTIIYKIVSFDSSCSNVTNSFNSKNIRISVLVKISAQKYIGNTFNKSPLLSNKVTEMISLVA